MRVHRRAPPGRPYLSAVSATIDRIVNGKIRVLALQGTLNEDELRKGLVTWPEVQHALRANARTDSLSSRYTIVLERNGDITVVEGVGANGLSCEKKKR